MNRTRKLLAIGATVVGFGGVGTVAAVAQNSASTKPAAVTPAPSADGDTLQQGDQTTLDVPGETGDPSVKSATAAAATTQAVTPAADPAAEKPGTETPGTETESPSDGPGGHADAPGSTVDHQFNGAE